MATRRIAVAQGDYMVLYNRLKQDNYTMFLGNASFYIPALKTKYINKNGARFVCGEWVTSGEYASRELKRQFPTGTRNWSYELRGKLSPPLMFSGTGSFRNVAYLDIRHAYAQIYRRLTLDIAYPRGNGTLPLRTVYDNLKFWKAARNAVVGNSISMGMDILKDGFIVRITKPSPFLNFALWHHIQVILNNVAEFAVNYCKAFYVFTDGYFLPMSRVNALEEFLQHYTLRYNVQYDLLLDIRGVGSYKIKQEEGDYRKKTMPYIAGWGSTIPRKNVAHCERKTIEWFGKQPQ